MAMKNKKGKLAKKKLGLHDKIFSEAGTLDTTNVSSDKIGSTGKYLNSTLALAKPWIENAAQETAKYGLVSGANNFSSLNATASLGRNQYKKENIWTAGIDDAATGASLGSTIGPWGTAIGAVGGYLSGMGAAAFGNSKRRDAAYDADVKQQSLLASDASRINSMNQLSSMNNIMANGGKATVFGEGGTHEENPNNGIQIGMNPNGGRNLVEEGEMQFEDMIFSNRLKPKKDFLLGTSLKASNGKSSYAEVAKKINKESQERPNDPISKKTQGKLLPELFQVQEANKPQPVQSQGQMMTGMDVIAADGDRFDFNQVEAQPMTTMDLIINPNAPVYSTLTDNSTPIEMPDVVEPNKVFIPNPSNLKSVTKGISPEQISQTNKGVGYSVPEKNKSWADKNLTEENMRYLPIIGAAAGTLASLGKPDYSFANNIDAAAARATSFKPIGGYQKYNPIDINYMTNKLSAQAGNATAAARASSAGNRGNYVSSLMALNQNAQNAIGDAYIKTDEANFGNRMKAADYNTNIDKFNSEMGQKASGLGLEAAIRSNLLRQQIRGEKDAARSANLTNLFESLGNVGKEAVARNMINSDVSKYYNIGRDGKIAYRTPAYESLTSEQKSYYDNMVAKKGIKVQ